MPAPPFVRDREETGISIGGAQQHAFQNGQRNCIFGGSGGIFASILSSTQARKEPRKEVKRFPCR